MIHGAALWLLVDALAVYRLCHLAAKDSITEKARKHLLDQAKRVAFEHATSTANAPTPIDTNWYGRLWVLVTCPWCLSVWLAAPVVALTQLEPSCWQYPAAGLALSAVTGLLAEHV